MDFRLLGLRLPNLPNPLPHMRDSDDSERKSPIEALTRAYVRNARTMAVTPKDVKEYSDSYIFVVDMPGLKFGDIKVKIEGGNMLPVSGERKREEEEEKEGAERYMRMERRVGEFMRNFQLLENANIEKISTVCQDGVLTVAVDKLHPPEPKKRRTIEVKIA